MTVWLIKIHVNELIFYPIWRFSCILYACMYVYICIYILPNNTKSLFLFLINILLIDSWYNLIIEWFVWVCVYEAYSSCDVKVKHLIDWMTLFWFFNLMISKFQVYDTLNSCNSQFAIFRYLSDMFLWHLGSKL